MAARAKPAEPDAELEVETVLRAGVAVVPLAQRRFNPQPARFIVGAAGDAQDALDAGSAELIILAVPEGELARALELVREAFDTPAV